MTKTFYDPVAVLLHWIMALVIIALLAVGMYMSDLAPNDPSKWTLYGLHKSVGVIAFGLVLLRVIWRFVSPPPAPIITQARWEQVLAHLVHMLLYIGMVMMPISGYVMSSAGGHAISVFGLFDVPLVIEKNKDLGETARAVHGLGGNLMVAAIALHFAGALKHHIKDKDVTMARMVPWLR